MRTNRGSTVYTFRRVFVRTSVSHWATEEKAIVDSSSCKFARFKQASMINITTLHEAVIVAFSTVQWHERSTMYLNYKTNYRKM